MRLPKSLKGAARGLLAGLVLLGGVMLMAGTTNPQQLWYTATSGTKKLLYLVLDSLPRTAVMYNALCDGTTDDSTAIQNALTSGKNVILPVGTCSLGTTGLSMTQYSQLTGQGAEQSILSITPTGCAITVDSVEGVKLADFRLNVLGASATKRGICLSNTTGNNLRNKISNVQVWGDVSNPRTSGTYGVYIHSTTSNSLYYNEFDHVDANLWDISYENLGDPTFGGSNANRFINIQSSAANTGIKFENISNNNFVYGLFCNGGGFSGTQTCVVVGDGVNATAGNQITFASDQGSNGTSCSLALGTIGNSIFSVNESTGACADANSLATTTNQVCEMKPGGTSSCSFGNVVISPNTIKLGVASSGTGGGLTMQAGGGGANSGGGDLTLKGGDGASSNGPAGNVIIAPGSRNGSGAGGSVTLGPASGLGAGSGVRMKASRYIIANKPFAPVDCAGAGINPSVSNTLDTSIFTCATAQNLTLPTAQGASGIIQGLPGTPAVGDIFELVMSSTAAANFTLVAGTGGTIVGNAVVNNAQKIWRCRVTVVTSGSETYSCY